MIKFITGSLLGIGLSRGNLVKLQQDMPIKIDLDDIGSPSLKYIVIFFGEDERTMTEGLKKFIGPDTKVTIDPRLKDH